MSPLFGDWMYLKYFCLLAPVIFGGLVVALDPSAFRGTLAGFASGIEHFKARWRSPWEEPWLPSSTEVGADPKADLALRVIGAALVAAGVLGLLEALG